MPACWANEVQTRLEGSIHEVVKFLPALFTQDFWWDIELFQTVMSYFVKRTTINLSLLEILAEAALCQTKRLINDV
jgi:hypothetical protein